MNSLKKRHLSSVHLAPCRLLPLWFWGGKMIIVDRNFPFSVVENHLSQPQNNWVYVCMGLLKNISVLCAFGCWSCPWGCEVLDIMYKLCELWHSEPWHAAELRPDLSLLCTVNTYTLSPVPRVYVLSVPLSLMSMSQVKFWPQKL